MQNKIQKHIKMNEKKCSTRFNEILSELNTVEWNCLSNQDKQPNKCVAFLNHIMFFNKSWSNNEFSLSFYTVDNQFHFNCWLSENGHSWEILKDDSNEQPTMANSYT
jgi:hypothetical protein